MSFDMSHREEILHLLSTHKITRSWYGRAFFDKRGIGHLFDIINHWFDHNEQLKDVSMVQKLYHIKENHENIPPTRFVNYVVGYLKGKRGSGYNKRPNSINYKSSEWFKDNLNKHIFDADNIKTVSDEDILELKHDLKVAKYKHIISDKPLLNYIFKQSKVHNIKPIEYIIKLKTGEDSICKCGEPKHIKRMIFLKTCVNKDCLSEYLSDVAKLKDLSRLHNREVWDKSGKTRRGKTPSEIHKLRLSISNKKYWTSEVKRKHTEINRLNGSYEKMSNTIKNKILDGKFTPLSTNRLNYTRLCSDITGISKYRSGWEVQFHEAHPHLKFEITRIPYTYNNKRHIYIVDFTDDVNKIIYEIKPTKYSVDDKTKAKFEYANSWASKNGYQFKLITEHDFPFS